MRLRSPYKIFILILIFSFISPVVSWGRVPVRTETSSGLHVAIFNTSRGKITVYLPSDMDTGDRISGSVIVEAAGAGEEERRKNREELNTYIIQLEEETAPVSAGVIGLNIPSDSPDWVTFLVLRDINGKELAKTVMTIENIEPTIKRPVNPTRWEYQLPMVGHAGKLVEVRGPFDGDLTSTQLKVGGKVIVILAESPRKLIFKSPEDVSGPTEIELKERDVVVKRKFNNLRLVKVGEETKPRAEKKVTKTEPEKEKPAQKDSPVVTATPLATPTALKTEAPKKETAKKEEVAPVLKFPEELKKIASQKEVKKDLFAVKETPAPIKEAEPLKEAKKGVLKEESLSPTPAAEVKKVETEKKVLALATPSPQPTTAPVKQKVEMEKEKTEKVPAPTPKPVEEVKKALIKEEAKKEPAAIRETPAPLKETEKKEVVKTDVNPTPNPAKEAKQTHSPAQEKKDLETAAIKKEEAPKKDVLPTAVINQPRGRYTIQVASYRDESLARNLSDSLKSKGYPAFIREANVPGKGVWHRVRVGAFKTIREAELYASRLKKPNTGVAAFFIAENN